MKSHKRNKSSVKAPIRSPSTAGRWIPSAGTGTLEPQKDQTRSAAVQMAGYSSGVIELTENNFAASINGHPFAVVDFWAPSSAPSRAFAPTFAAAAARNPDVLFVRVNTEDQQAICTQFNIRSTPTLMILRSNIIVHAKPVAADGQGAGRSAGGSTSPRHGAGTAQGSQSGCGHAGHARRADNRCSTCRLQRTRTPSQSKPIYAHRFADQCSALMDVAPRSGGRRTRRDKRCLRRRLRRADV